MPSATVEIAFVNPPQPGKKLGSIKDTDGNYYGVATAMLGMFQQGGNYEIFFEDRQWQGKTYHTVQTVRPVEKLPQAASKVVERARTPQADADRMWVCALLGHAMQAGQLDSAVLSDVVERGKLFLEAQGYIFSDKALPTERANGPTPVAPQTKAHPGTADALSDEIPFGPEWR